MGLADYLKFKIGADSSKYEKAMSRVRKTTEKNVGSATKMFKGLQGQIAILAGAYGLKRLSTSLWDVATGFEQMEAKLDVITRGEGKKTLEEINTLALDLPVSTEKAVAGFTTMTAMGLEPTIEQMKTMIDVGSILGDDVITRLSLQLGQAAAKGKIMGQDLNIMAEAGINARKYLKDAFGMTQQELLGSGIDINKQISVIFKGMEKDFGGSAERMKQAGKGLVATFKSYATEISRQFMNAGVYQEVKQAISDINDKMLNWLQYNSGMLKQKVPEYIDKIKTGLENIWKIISYDPAILEWGIVGLAFGGRKGAVIMGAIGHMASWADNLSKALGLAAGGVIDFSEIATANFKELEALVQRFENYQVDQSGFFFKIPEQPKLETPLETETMPPPIKFDPLAGYDQAAADALHDALNQKQVTIDEFDEIYKQSQMSTWEWEQEQLIEQANAYTQAGADKIAVQEWVSSELMRSYQNEADYKAKIEEQKNKTEQQVRKNRINMAVSLGTSLLKIAGANAKMVFLATKALDVGTAIMGAHAGAAQALASVPYPANLAAAATVLKWGYVNAAVIAASALGSLVSGGGGSSGSVSTADYNADHDSTIPAINDTGSQETKSNLNIIFEGDVRIEDEAYIEELAAKISEAVEDREVTLIASNSQYAGALA